MTRSAICAVMVLVTAGCDEPTLCGQPIRCGTYTFTDLNADGAFARYPEMRDAVIEVTEGYVEFALVSSVSGDPYTIRFDVEPWSDTCKRVP